jgi:hypothetical protein
MCSEPDNCRHSSRSSSLDKRIRDRFISTNLDLFLIAALLVVYHVGWACASEETSAAHAEEDTTTTTTPDEVTSEHGTASEEEILVEQEYSAYAVLYPWYG